MAPTERQITEAQITRAEPVASWDCIRVCLARMPQTFQKGALSLLCLEKSAAVAPSHSRPEVAWPLAVNYRHVHRFPQACASTCQRCTACLHAERVVNHIRPALVRCHVSSLGRQGVCIDSAACLPEAIQPAASWLEAGAPCWQLKSAVPFSCRYIDSRQEALPVAPASRWNAGAWRACPAALMH